MRTALTHLLFLLLLLPAALPAAIPLAGDSIDTGKGPLVIHPIHHATFVLSWHGKVIYFDPVGPADRYEGLPSPDLIFITDIHPDHLNADTLHDLVTEATQLVAPAAVYAKLPADLQARTLVIGNGEHQEIGGIGVDAIAMYNLPQSPKAYHTKGRGNGYVLDLGGKRIYDSGDTDNTPEMRALKNIDVAFVCMNPPYTMPVEEAADAVLAFKPRIVYPFHYRSPNGMNDVDKFEQLVTSADPSIDVRLRDWYPAD